jgi:hypothetical protein
MMKADERQAIRDYKDLQVWQKSMELAKQIYRTTQILPQEEKFRLVA